MLAQSGYDPALHNLNAYFRFRFIECQQLQVVLVNQPAGSASFIRFIH